VPQVVPGVVVDPVQRGVVVPRPQDNAPFFVETR